MTPRDRYVWQVPGNPLEVQIGLPVIDRMKAEIMQTFRSDPERGVEVGGLLLGRMDGESVIIEDFALVPSEHRRGQSYDLSPNDRQRLAKRLSKKPKKGLTPVGFFRSHTRPGLYLDEDDHAVIEQHFPAPQVVLLVRPRNGGDATAGFFFWEDGEMVRKQSYLTFPFSSQQLRTGNYKILDGAAAAAPVRQPAQPLTAPRPLTEPRASASGWPQLNLRPALPWVALVALAVLALIGYSAWSPRQDLALRVDREGSVLRINWNRKSPLVRHADRGVLWIRDGGQQKRVDLDPQELTHGSVAFWPSSPDVDFRLEVNSGTQTTTEAVRTLAKASAPAPPPRVQPVVPPPAPAPIPAVAAVPPSIVSAPLIERIPQVPLHSAPPEAAAPLLAKVSPPPVIEPPVAAMPEPPPPAPVEVPLHTPTPIEKPALRAPSAAASVDLEPADVSVLRKTVAHIPLFSQIQHHQYKAGKDFVAAHPVRRISPTVPPHVAKELTGEQAVDLKVSIDKTGRVTHTELVSKESDEELAELASNAARNSDFQPARIGDHPVASEMFMHFRFAPK